MRRLHASPLRDAPLGFYALAGIGVQRALVVPELPAAPETLFLRLMGRGEVLQRALQEALALPEANPLGRAVSAHVHLFQETFASLGLRRKASQEESMFTPEVVHAFYARVERERRALQQQAREQGLEQGSERGELHVLEVLCKQRLGRALSAAEQAGLTRRLHGEGVEETTLGALARDAAALEAWLLEAPEPPA